MLAEGFFCIVAPPTAITLVGVYILQRLGSLFWCVMPAPVIREHRSLFETPLAHVTFESTSFLGCLLGVDDLLGLYFVLPSYMLVQVFCMLICFAAKITWILRVGASGRTNIFRLVGCHADADTTFVQIVQTYVGTFASIVYPDLTCASADATSVSFGQTLSGTDETFIKQSR